MSEHRATSVLPKSEWSERRYFIWRKGWLRSEVEAQIVTETFMPKDGVLFKKELLHNDPVLLGDCIRAWPAPKTEAENAKG